MGEIVLFTSKFSPFGQRVQVALTEKEIPFKITVVDFANKSQAFLDANPIHKKVPAIIHNGKAVAESLVILEYLEDAFPEHPLMPKDAYERSQVRFWADYIYKLFASTQGIIKMKPGTPEKQAFDEIVGSLKTLESAMTSYSAEGPFFTGNKFGYLDVVFGPFKGAYAILDQLCGVATPGADELPRLHKWVEVIKAHPSCSCIPSGEETVAMLKARFQEAAAAPLAQ